MSILIIKLSATGDVVRTTPLLRRFDGPVSWVAEKKNVTLLQGIEREVRCVSWEDRGSVSDTKYDLVINLEDDRDAGLFLKELRFKQLFGAHLDAKDKLTYTPDSRGWFDLSLISAYGRHQADHLKLLNRRTYQELIFEGLGLSFSGEAYYLPPARPTGLNGDVAISSTAGPVWPMKKWAYYDELTSELEAKGLKVNVLLRGHPCSSTWPMFRAIDVSFRGIACQCIWPWEAACGVYPFLPAQVHGRYMSMDCRKRSSLRF